MKIQDIIEALKSRTSGTITACDLKEVYIVGDAGGHWWYASVTIQPKDKRRRPVIASCHGDDREESIRELIDGFGSWVKVHNIQLENE